MENETMNPLVSICCITYNQVSYIRECLDSFLNQKTTFKFEILIHDDCSTDGTKEIIEEYVKVYPDIFIPLYETENLYSKGIRGIMAKYVFPRATGKYCALCEGDDYWTDPYKLQKQVDFLESHPEYGMCFTKARQYIQNTGKFSSRNFGNEERQFKDLLIKGNNITTLTTVVRKDLFDKYYLEVKPETKNWRMGDYPLWLYIASKSKIKFMDIDTGVYRVLDNSASHCSNINKRFEFVQSYYDIQKFFGDINSINTDILDVNLLKFEVCCEELKKGYTFELRDYLNFYYREIKFKDKKLKLKHIMFNNKFLTKLVVLIKN